jgi:uncharacterized protein
VSLDVASWNQLVGWLRELELLRDQRAARANRAGKSPTAAGRALRSPPTRLGTAPTTQSGLKDGDQLELTVASPRMPHRIEFDRQRLGDLCRRRHVRRLALFGSVLRDDFGPASDVDVLVEFEPGYVPGFAFFELEEELTALIGRRVDLHTPGSVSRYFRERVLREAQNQYVGA